MYHPLRTAWLAAADELGARTVDGLGMLIHQAALQQQCWLGTLPDVDVMRAAAEVHPRHPLTRRADRSHSGRNGTGG